MAPPNSSSFSVSVVLPASGWEMIANVRRRATSAGNVERDGGSVGTAISDIGLWRLAGEPGWIKEPARHSSIYGLSDENQFTGRPILLTSSTPQYPRPASPAEAGGLIS